MKTKLLFKLFYLLRMYVRRFPHRNEQKRLLVVRLDAIGDYVLFRNYLSVLRQSPQYTGYHITLLGAPSWRGMAEELEKETVDAFLSLDWKELYDFSSWKILFYAWQLYRGQYDVVINPMYTRTEVSDLVVELTGAPIRIGSEGIYEQVSSPQRLAKSKPNYTRIIPATAEIMFEFERNREFFSALLGDDLEGVAFLPPKAISDLPPPVSSPYVVVFIGGSTPDKRWPLSHYTEVVTHLLAHTSHTILLAGAPTEWEDAQTIQTEIGDKQDRVRNICGETSLTGLYVCVAGASMTLSNDTCALHMSASAGTLTIGLYTGLHLGRFGPYPKDKPYGKHVTSLYPPPLTDKVITPSLMQSFQEHTSLSIADIDTHQVIEAIQANTSALFTHHS